MYDARTTNVDIVDGTGNPQVLSNGVYKQYKM